MHHTIRSFAVLTIILAQSALPGAQTPQRGAKPTQDAPADAKPAPAAQPAQPGAAAVRPGPASGDQRLVVPSGFTVDYPKKDWQTLVGVGSSVVVLFHRSREAAVAIERTKVSVPLAINEINEQTAKLEVEDWQVRRPLTTSSLPQFVDFNGARTLIIDFTQPGAQGSEHVRLYAMPRGTDLFRAICTTTVPTFDKYKETCHRIALSVTATP
jgi:hypothetical protein